MNGTNITSGAALPTLGPSWHYVASADFNGDGKADILWQNDNGATAVWLMNGTSVSAGAILPNTGTSWHVVSVQDFNGDGKADIFWENDAGSTAVWLMNGTQILSGSSTTTDATINTASANTASAQIVSSGATTASAASVAAPGNGADPNSLTLAENFQFALTQSSTNAGIADHAPVNLINSQFVFQGTSNNVNSNHELANETVQYLDNASWVDHLLPVGQVADSTHNVVFQCAANALSYLHDLHLFA
jgi:hypothetical protein